MAWAGGLAVVELHGGGWVNIADLEEPPFSDRNERSGEQSGWPPSDGPEVDSKLWGTRCYFRSFRSGARRRRHTSDLLQSDYSADT